MIKTYYWGRNEFYIQVKEILEKYYPGIVYRPDDGVNRFTVLIPEVVKDNLHNTIKSIPAFIEIEKIVFMILDPDKNIYIIAHDMEWNGYSDIPYICRAIHEYPKKEK